MDKLLEYCKARYDEELGFKFSLANIFAWLFFVVSIFISSNNLADVVFCGLSQIKVKKMLDMSDGVPLPYNASVSLFGRICNSHGVAMS